MKYRREGAEKQLSKQDYAMTCAGASAYLLARQGDAVGLASFADEFIEVPSRARRGQLQEIFSKLEALESSGATRFGSALNQLAEGISKRMSLIVFFRFARYKLGSASGPLASCGPTARCDLISLP